MIVEHNAGFFEHGADAINLFHQADAHGSITGDWVKLTNYTRVAVLLIKGGVEDVGDLGLQFLQAKDAAGTGSKVLNFPANGRISYKSGSGDWTSCPLWTQVTAPSAIDGLAFGNNVPSGFTRAVPDMNTSALQLIAEFQATDLDADNGFSWFTAKIDGANVGGACLMSGWAFLLGSGYAGPVPTNAIA